jgi:excisionase family DNA binding protein
MTPKSFTTDAGPLSTVTEVAHALRVSKMTVYRLVHDGTLPAMRLGDSFRAASSTDKRRVDWLGTFNEQVCALPGERHPCTRWARGAQDWASMALASWRTLAVAPRVPRMP